MLCKTSLKYAIYFAAFILPGCSYLGLGGFDTARPNVNPAQHGQYYPQQAQAYSPWAAQSGAYASYNSHQGYYQAPNPGIYGTYQSGPIRPSPQQAGPTAGAYFHPSIAQNRALQNRIVPHGSSAIMSMQNALGQSNLIESKRLEMREAQEEYTQARAASLPQFNLSGSFGYANRQSNSSVASIDDVSTSQETGGLRAGVSQPIYAGGQNKSQKRRAKASISAAEQDLRATTSNVALSTIQAHLDVIRANNVLNFYTRSVANLDAQKAATSLLFEYGEATIADTSLVEAQLQSTKVEAGQAELRLTDSLTNYQFLTGHRARNLAPPSFANLPATLDQAVNMALVKNPAVLKARAEWDVAQNDLKIAKAQRLPNLSLDGAVSEALGQSDFVASSSSATLSLNLRVPFSLGGQYKSQIQQANHVLSRRKVEERQTMMQLRRDITLKWNALQTANDSITLRQHEIDANDAAYRSLQEQFQSGVATQSELLSAESDLLSANIKLEDAKYQEQFLRAELLALLGNLDMAGHSVPAANSYVEAPLSNRLPRSRY